MDRKEILSKKKRIVIKVGTTTITYEETGNINLDKLEKFVRILINLRNQGKEVIVVSSGAVGVGRNALGLDHRPDTEAEKQACAAVGQGRLMMIYEKLFNEYSQLTAQVLLTKESVTNEECRKNARQTFDALLNMHVVPIVNENDAISVDELAYGNFGDNDTLAANVAELVEADLLILLSGSRLVGRSAPSPPEREITTTAVSEYSFADSKIPASSYSSIVGSGIVQSCPHIPTVGRVSLNSL